MRLPAAFDATPNILRWAALVKTNMVQRNWSIRKLAQVLGKSPQFVSQLLSAYAHGKRRPVIPSFEVVDVVDKELGVPKEQQYQALGLDRAFASDRSNQIGLGASLMSDSEFVQTMQTLQRQYEQRIQQNPEQRVRELEARVQALERQLGRSATDLTK